MRKSKILVLVCVVGAMAVGCASLGLYFPKAESYGDLAIAKGSLAYLESLQIIRDKGAESVKDDVAAVLPFLLDSRGVKMAASKDDAAVRLTLVISEAQEYRGFDTVYSVKLDLALYEKNTIKPQYLVKIWASGGQSLSDYGYLVNILKKAVGMLKIVKSDEN